MLPLNSSSTSSSRECLHKGSRGPPPPPSCRSRSSSYPSPCTVDVVQRPSCPGRHTTFAKLIEIDSAVSSRLAWEAFLGMATPFPAGKVAEDASDPNVRRPELEPDQEGWKIYDESKAAWVDAWTHYYDSKAATNETRWAQYEKSKNDVQRRWRSATESRPSRPSTLKSAKGAPAATKISFNLSVDTDLAAAARQWSIPDRFTPRPDGTNPKPQPCVFYHLSKLCICIVY